MIQTTMDLPQSLNGGSFHLYWGNHECHSSWGDLDTLLRIQKQIGGALERSKDYKEKYGTHILVDEIVVLLFSNIPSTLSPLCHQLLHRINSPQD
jgi:hypothetical protein